MPLTALCKRTGQVVESFSVSVSGDDGNACVPTREAVWRYRILTHSKALIASLNCAAFPWFFPAATM